MLEGELLQAVVPLGDLARRRAPAAQEVEVGHPLLEHHRRGRGQAEGPVGLGQRAALAHHDHGLEEEARLLLHGHLREEDLDPLLHRAERVEVAAVDVRGS
ncbi:hypothetical protein Q0F99_17660 [Rathayibacter oskolensis]|uniref:hypothetical protein n=1 Tax=Rathayibacter oskolensis TaxID=1891671 RepID=UPI0026603AEF|nr:hypothetical protein [Rathayibacter oskolensis]WKK71270.1 hypothetical protein Q0F99_17660 [Rathayibacter oskolensis]